MSRVTLQVIRRLQQTPFLRVQRNLCLTSTRLADNSKMTKAELQARRIENDNPFETYTLKPDAGTGRSAKSPILIPSTEDSRLVGCSCEADYDEVIWFNLHKGKTQQCDCGYYFKLIDHSPLDDEMQPLFGKGFGSGMGRFN